MLCTQPPSAGAEVLRVTQLESPTRWLHGVQEPRSPTVRGEDEDQDQDQAQAAKLPGNHADDVLLVPSYRGEEAG